MYTVEERHGVCFFSRVYLDTFPIHEVVQGDDRAPSRRYA